MALYTRFPFAFAPGWTNVTPFVLKDAEQYKPGPLYKLTSKKYAADLNEVKSIGVKVGSTRTPEQTQIGFFWIESSALSWNRIARTVSASEGLDLWENARLFGLLNIAMADGYVGTFDTKYFYNFWRPVTAIQLADTDGNPATIADPVWEPLAPRHRSRITTQATALKVARRTGVQAVLQGRQHQLHSV